MARALSIDLRERVLAAVDDGMSCRQAAGRFGVSASVRSAGMTGGAERVILGRSRRAGIAGRDASKPMPS